MPRRKFSLLFAACLSLLLTACASSSSHRKVIVLGVDAMDAGFIEANWNALPNLARLRELGSFSRLRTTDPPQSPVAWATFSTGLSPDQHGLYDFVERDPATLQPFSSFGRIAESPLALPLGPYRIPLRPARLVSLRHGIVFWQLLADAGVPVTIIKMPDNYPPVHAGRELAGMGTPDLNGSLGTFSFYSSDPGELSRAVDGGRIEAISVKNGRAELPLIGPPNTLRKDGRYEVANISADVDPDRPLVRFTVDGQLLILKTGEWSSWVAVSFPVLLHLQSASGMVRFFLKQAHPNLEVYVSPININPFNPALPISYPASLSKEIARQVGPFSTLGIPEDTSALRNGFLDRAEFDAQSQQVLDDEERLLSYSLQHFKDGLLFYYFSSIDQNSHVDWGQHNDALLEVYRVIDRCVGEVMRVRPDAQLIVMSDHGFTSFTRAVHLNTWLYENGFLALKTAPEDNTGLTDIDWTRTEAYALGLNGLYLNLAGREKCGIVHPGAQAHALAGEIRTRLLALRDPATGRNVVTRIFLTHPSRENAQTAPDMIVGYAAGYRGSWQTALGRVPPEVISDNVDEWMGDHCIDPTAVPGVLFSSSKATLPDPALQDVTATILALFHVKPAVEMHGRSIYN